MTVFCPELHPEHYCMVCQPERFPTADEPMHEGHLATRWGDRSRGDWRLLLNGVDVTDDTFEAVVGTEGYIYRYTQHRSRLIPAGRFLHCRGGPCAEVVRGDVRLVYESKATA